MQTAPPPPRRIPAVPSRSESISWTRASIATSSAQRSTTSPALNRSRLYISSARPPRSRSRSSRTSSRAFRSRLSSRAGGTTYPPDEVEVVRCSVTSATLELEDDETLFGHLANRVRRSFPRIPGILDASIRHLIRPERRRLVDRDPAELELPRGVQRGLDVPGEHPGLQPVARSVRECDRLVERVVRTHRAEWTEDLFTRDLGVRRSV